MASSQHRCVFVGNIPYDATEEQLIQICEEVGPVVSFRLVLDRETGKPKGYGFCEYKDEETALSARRNLQGYEINGRQLRVDFAENDKNADRSREQGRGGPGLTSNIDAQKPLGGGPVTLGDSSLHQPVGLQLAATAASVMAGALGEQKTSGWPSNQNGFQSQPGLGNDPLTHYLARMSRAHLYEIMSELKAMVIQNKTLARQLLLASPQLPKALFQAQVMLGMVTPQVLQMPNIRQPSTSIPQPSQCEDKQPISAPHLGQTLQLQNNNNLQAGLLARIPEGQVVPPVVPPDNALISQPSSLPLQQHLPSQPRFPQYHQQGQAPVLSSVSTAPSIRPNQPATGLSIWPQTHPSSLDPKGGLKQQLQTPLLQHVKTSGVPHAGNSSLMPLPNSNFRQSLLSRPLSSQVTFQPGSSNSSALHGGVDTISMEAGSSAQFGHEPTWGPRKDSFEPMDHPPKLARLDNGSRVSRMINSNASISGSLQGLGVSAVPSNRTGSIAADQQPEKQVPQSSLPPEMESALLQQVMSLTSEQLSSLPPEQQQQVLQLQQMLRTKREIRLLVAYDNWKERCSTECSVLVFGSVVYPSSLSTISSTPPSNSTHAYCGAKPITENLD